MRKTLVRIAFIAFGCCAAALAPAQEPEIPKLMRIIVPFSPGGSNDQIARAIAPALAKRLGNSVIVENKPGAGGVIGSDTVAKAAPDGATLLLSSSSFLTAAATQPRTPFDPVGSFAPVSMIAEGPLLLAVSATSRHRTPQALLSAARDKPGSVSYASSGVGSVAQLASELLSADAKLQLLHVPYKGAANALLDLVAGQVDFMLSNYSSLAPQIKAGKVRPLAVTSRDKSDVFPDLPPLSASVPGYAIEIWVGVLAPAGTPQALVQRLNRELNEISLAPEVRTLLDPDGARPATMAPADYAARIKSDFVQWKRIATERSIVIE
jgi:tripartite-type tricarboxylate transporter receptor subunit TctC